MKRANNLPLAKKMGFKEVDEMLKVMGYSSHKLADLKGNTPEERREKQERKLKELIVSYYKVDASGLVDALELYKASKH